MSVFTGTACAVLAIAGFAAVQLTTTETGAPPVPDVTWLEAPLAVAPIIRDGKVRTVLLMQFGITVVSEQTSDPTLMRALALDAFQTAAHARDLNEGIASFDTDAFEAAFKTAMATSPAGAAMQDIAITLVDERAADLLRQPAS